MPSANNPPIEPIMIRISATILASLGHNDLRFPDETSRILEFLGLFEVHNNPKSFSSNLILS